MSHWWVPGLQIGYEHTSIHQVGGFSGRRWARARRASPTFREALADRGRDRRAVLEIGRQSEQWETVLDRGRLTKLLIALGLAMATAMLRTWGPAVPPLAPTSGFAPIFDGRTLNGWDGDPNFWQRGMDGAMVGQTTGRQHQPTAEHMQPERRHVPRDFELKLQYKLTGVTGNSGVQYRSVELPDDHGAGDEGLPGGHRRRAALRARSTRNARRRFWRCAGRFAYVGERASGRWARSGPTGPDPAELKSI